MKKTVLFFASLFVSMCTLAQQQTVWIWNKGKAVEQVADSIWTEDPTDTTYTPVVIEDGALPGYVEVGYNKKVRFSQGNLQYQASTGTWRFAEHQYDMIGAANDSVSPTYNGWIDLFGWGTSGWESGAIAYMPYDTVKADTAYRPGGDYKNNLVGDYANADWGVYNKISNGGNETGKWRTLTKSEWYYIINNRSGSMTKLAQATVNGVRGLVILPEKWTTPKEVTFKPRVTNFTTNVYDNWQWEKMASAGAIFLPAAGEREKSGMSDVGVKGYYWSSTSYSYNNYQAYNAYFSNSGIYFDTSENRLNGLSVRLVQDY